MTSYGNFVFHLTLDRTDRVGLRSIIASLMWGVRESPAEWEQLLESLDAAEPAPPRTPPGMEFMGRDRTHEGGAFYTHWTYQGVHMNGKDVVVKDRSNSPDFRFDPGFSQVGLETHRNLATLIEKFDGSFTPEGEVYFPPQFSGPAPSGIGFNKGANAKFNPMFGEHDYYSMEGTYSFRYITKSEVGIGDSENEIHETGDLPGRAPRYPGRNWLKAPTQWQHIAGYYEVLESFWLSRAGGWKEPIYGKLSSQFGSGLGLITGGLQASGGLT